jgi:hypothetical protein
MATIIHYLGDKKWGMGSRIIIVHKNFILSAIGEWGN